MIITKQSEQESRQWFHAVLERFYEYNRENWRGMNLLDYIHAHESEDDFEKHLTRVVGYFDLTNTESEA